ncbi:MAG: DUF2769 domain-containing protein [Bacteriovorax sp.]|nr:DUF2769 domain-containing protein [Bacteriovorax sp.]
MIKVEKTQSSLKKCICEKCPSYTKCSKEKNEKLFCAKEVGKSSCEKEMNGCICGTCPIQKENFLLVGYYCINGSAEEIENKIGK